MIKLTRKVGGKKVKFCLDRYEFPGKGSKPRTRVNWNQAQSACKTRGKRLCTKAEWRVGCGGKYPYGSAYDPTRCNTIGEDEEERPLVPAGSMKGCKSPSGAYDMTGNASEWTEEGTVNGGSSDRHGDSATCSRATKRYKGSGNGFVGFRCCSDLD